MKKMLFSLSFVTFMSFVFVFAHEYSPNDYRETPTCPSINTNIKRGMKNDNVYKLQSYLYTYFAIEAKPTGYFGSFTLQKVIEFQEEMNLPQTGYVGVLTRKAIDNYCLNLPAKPPTTGKTGEPQANCKVWSDGCNTCTRSKEGGDMACTLMYCFNPGTPYCKETF